jgi:type I restriction enzyme S subunit
MSAVSTPWPIVPLHEICRPKQWPTIPQTSFLKEGYPVYGANGMIGYYSEFNHEKPTVLITCRGATCGTINLCAPKSYVTGNAMALDDLDETRVELRYLVRALQNGSLRKAISGTAQPQITREGLTVISIPLPPLAEQRRIAEVLDRTEALRAKRRAALAQLDTLTQSIFFDLFGDPAINPKGWPCRPLGELAEKFSDGPFGSNLKTSHYTECGIRVIRLQNIGVGEFVDGDKAYISERHFAELKKHECRPGDVLVATLGDPNLRACIQPDWLKIALNKADCVQCRPNNRLANATYLCTLLNQPSTERMAQDLIVGQTRLRISMGRLRGLRVPVPPLVLQDSFARRVTAVEKLKAAHRASLTELNALFAMLQHRAFRGEL